MKIRTGFVSNSSSSNFVVAFPKKPQRMEDVKEMLFGSDEWYSSPYPEYNKQHGWDTIKVATTVWNDIKGQEPNNLHKLYDAVRNGWFEGIPEFDDFKAPTSSYPNNTDYDAWSKEADKVAENILLNFLIQNEHAFVYAFSYGDEEGEYFSDLEHGDLFNKLQHLHISCH